MKHLFLLFLVIFSLIANAQKFKRFDNFKCAVDHKCNVKKAFNDSNNSSSTYKSQDVSLSEPTFVGDKPLEVTIMKVIGSNKNQMMVLMFSGKIKDCSDTSAYVSLLLKSGDRVTLPCISKSADCHSNVIMTGVADADVALAARAVKQVHGPGFRGYGSCCVRVGGLRADRAVVSAYGHGCLLPRRYRAPGRSSLGPPVRARHTTQE